MVIQPHVSLRFFSVPLLVALIYFGMPLFTHALAQDSKLITGGKMPFDFKKVSKRIAANSAVLIISEDGRVLASGAAGKGRGDADENDRNHFLPVEGLAKVVQVECDIENGQSAAALDDEGFVFHWKETELPARLSGFRDVVSISLSDDHLVAIDETGQLLTQGLNSSGNARGQLGSGTIDSYLGKQELPRVITIEGVSDAIAVAAGTGATFVLRKDGSVWGCGDNLMLGKEISFLDVTDSSPEELSTPTLSPIGGLKEIVAIAAGWHYTLALDKHGDVWGWGINRSGQLGSEVDDSKSIAPKKLEGLHNIKAISAGYDFLLALDDKGKVFAMGCNVHGALGDPGEELEGDLRQIRVLENIKQIYAGYFNAFAVDTANRIYGWGNNTPDAAGFTARQKTDVIVPTKFETGEIEKSKHQVRE